MKKNQKKHKKIYSNHYQMLAENDVGTCADLGTYILLKSARNSEFPSVYKFCNGGICSALLFDFKLDLEDTELAEDELVHVSSLQEDESSRLELDSDDSDSSHLQCLSSPPPLSPRRPRS
jgi:hypothetical protein